ncbi:MAG: hypothetical protein A2Z29_08655 [Chloroflexi bacterium RBG_16_56_11]|nr:MAG: hypothetical protein A2Z29_08655 [Chloroflexi bacterium RBG_16_56_11]
MSDTTDKDTDFRLWRLLDHTRFVISRSREKELARFGMTPEQAHVLDILHQSGGKATIQEIVNITMRQHHSISTLVGRMAKQGLVKKIRSASDSRQYNVNITEKGRALFQSITRRSVEEIFGDLTERDKKALQKVLKKLQVKAYQSLGKKYRPTILSDLETVKIK